MLDYSILKAPIAWLFDPQSRTYLGYWLSTLVIILFWALLSWQKRLPYLQQLLKKSYWWNPSTRQDYAILIINSLLFAFASLSWVVFTLTVANSSYAFLNNFWQPRALTNASPTLLFSGFALALILIEDLSRYGLHRLLHFKMLWRIHQLHHSATVLTPFSFMRVHPLEKLLYQIRSASVYGGCTGVFFFLVGEHPQNWLVFGIAASTFIFNILGANLRHSMIPISYGRLEKIFISPLQHQLHHSQQHCRQNYGSTFAFWDLLFNSWASTDTPAALPSKSKPLINQLLLKKMD